MDTRQLFILFLCGLIPWTVGNGLLPLLPVYAVRLGASPSAAGTYLALSYIAITLGALAAGWLSDRLQSHKSPLIAAGVAGVPVIWLMGIVADLSELTIVTAILWFLGGMGMSLASILAGLFAGEEERGKVFGVLALASPIGALVGGLASGPIADHFGFPAMFATFALFSISWPAAALLVKDKTASRPAHDGGPRTVATLGLSWPFYLLFLASLSAVIANFVGSLGRSLDMRELGFSAAAISSTGAVGGAATLPLIWLAGMASDRFGRRRFLACCYLAGATGLGLLGISAALWHFWIAVSLTSMLVSVNRGVGSALVADLVPQAALGRGMAIFVATTWLGGVVGFAVTGFAVQSVGFAPTFFMAALLPLASMVLLLPIRPTRPSMDTGLPRAHG